MEPPFWHIYVIMAAKIIFKLDLSLTVRVSAHCFGVTSPCLCDTFPKFGDLFSHRDNGDLEQQGRKGSVRVFGVPKTTEGTTDTKILSVLDEQMKLDPPPPPPPPPPIVIEDLEVIHRLGTWWRHQMETFFALLALCAGNSPVSGEFPAQRPVTRSFGVFFDLRLIKRLSKQSWGWWFETLSSPLWRHCNASHRSHQMTPKLMWNPKQSGSQLWSS